jgi:putative transposase
MRFSGIGNLAVTGVRETAGMTQRPPLCHRHRFPTGISQAMWLYYLFSLSLRDIELVLAERGVQVTQESIRQWCRKFGAEFAKRLRRRRPRPGDTWHMDEVFIRINGVLHYRWRTMDQHGVVLDILVQERRDGAAAKRFFRRLLQELQYQPKRIITDSLRSYGVARRALPPDVKHRTSRYLNNRAENSHRPPLTQRPIDRRQALRQPVLVSPMGVVVRNDDIFTCVQTSKRRLVDFKIGALIFRHEIGCFRDHTLVLNQQERVGIQHDVLKGIIPHRRCHARRPKVGAGLLAGKPIA